MSKVKITRRDVFMSMSKWPSATVLELCEGDVALANAVHDLAMKEVAKAARPAQSVPSRASRENTRLWTQEVRPYLERVKSATAREVADSCALPCGANGRVSTQKAIAVLNIGMAEGVITLGHAKRDGGRKYVITGYELPDEGEEGATSLDW